MIFVMVDSYCCATGSRLFRFVRGPIFTNLLLADEINRTPPKTQAALLQAMQEYRVTVGGETFTMDPPFLVFATQNPIEQEGTYPLPEAQLDRFMMNVDIGYPTETEEVQIALRTTAPVQYELKRVLSIPEIIRLQDLVLRVPVADAVGVQGWYVITGGVVALMAVGAFFIPPLLRLEEGQTIENGEVVSWTAGC